MLKFVQQGPKCWAITYQGKEQMVLNLSSSTVTNKYYIVTDFIERMSAYFGEPFCDWLVDFLNECKDESKRAGVVSNNVDTIKKYSDEFLESLNIDYSKFVDTSKAKKGSILFLENEIKEIIKLSSYLKIYSLISNNVDLKLGQKFHRDIYNKFAFSITETEIASKIFNVVKTKTFRYNMTDKFMWDYIKTIQCKDIGTHIIEIFNFIMNNIIILCEEDKNPITYFVGVIDESVKWFLRSVYKGTIVYEDEISTEDVHSSHIDNLKTYSFNDTFGRLKAIAFEKIYTKLELDNSMKAVIDDSDQYIIDLNNRLATIEYVSPLCQSLVFPILSKMTDISYVHFKTISPEHSAVLSYYLNRLLEKEFRTEYRILFSLLDYYPETAPSMNTTYKVKSVHQYLALQNKVKNFMGFESKIYPYEMMGHFVGKVSRINFKHLLTGQKLTGIPLTKVETEMITFYTMLFAGKLDGKIEKLTMLMNGDF